MEQNMNCSTLKKNISAYEEVRRTNGNTFTSNSVSSHNSNNSSLDHSGTGVNLFTPPGMASGSIIAWDSACRSSDTTLRNSSVGSYDGKLLESLFNLDFERFGLNSVDIVQTENDDVAVGKANEPQASKDSNNVETRCIILPIELALALSRLSDLFVVQRKPLRATAVSDKEVLIRFDDYRHAREALAQGTAYITAQKLESSIDYVTNLQYNGYVAGIDKTFIVDEMEGHAYVLVTSMIGPLKHDTFVNQALAEVKNFGALHTSAEVLGDQGPMTSCFGLHLEFCSIKDCAQFVDRFQRRQPTKLFKSVYLQTMAKGNLLQALSHWSGEPACVNVNSLQNDQQTEEITTSSPLDKSVATSTDPSLIANSAKHDASSWTTPSGFSPPTYQPVATGAQMVASPFAQQFAVPHYQYPFNVSNIIPRAANRGAPCLVRPPPRGILHNNNPVDVNRIMRGEDVRTTVMLRNIPNKMNCHELKQTIDVFVRNCYDFSYLRIDFNNGMNVGYAFINFSHPSHIAQFAMAMQHRRWDVYNSDKHAEISYATKQGIHSLIDAFRNSSVMEEHPDARPKLWFTDMDRPDLAGQERPFPPSDNHLKLQRSRDNKRSNGLYAAHRGRTQFGPPFSNNYRGPLLSAISHGYDQFSQIAYPVSVDQGADPFIGNNTQTETGYRRDSFIDNVDSRNSLQVNRLDSSYN